MDPYDADSWLRHAHAAAAVLTPHAVPRAPLSHWHDHDHASSAHHSKPAAQQLPFSAVRRWLATQRKLALENGLSQEERHYLAALGLHWIACPEATPLCNAHFDAVVRALREELRDVPYTSAMGAQPDAQQRSSLLQRRQRVQGPALGSIAQAANLSEHSTAADTSAQQLLLQEALATVVQAYAPESLAHAASPIDSTWQRSVLVDWLHQCAAMQRLGWLPAEHGQQLSALVREWAGTAAEQVGLPRWQDVPLFLASQMPSKWSDELGHGLAIRAAQVRPDFIEMFQHGLRARHASLCRIVEDAGVGVRPSHAAQLLAVTGQRSQLWFT